MPFLVPLVGPSALSMPHQDAVICSPDAEDLSHYVHIIIISFTGVIYKSIEPILQLLGVSPSALSTLLRTLHVKAVTSADSITRLRRALERDPATFFPGRTSVRTSARRPLPQSDPP